MQWVGVIVLSHSRDKLHRGEQFSSCMALQLVFYIAAHDKAAPSYLRPYFIFRMRTGRKNITALYNKRQGKCMFITFQEKLTMITAFGESSNNYDVTNFVFRTVRCNIFIQYKPTKCTFPPELISEFMISSTCFETEGLSSGRLPWFVYVWLPWLRFFRAFSSVVRQMPG
jgi:hypothetical protein